MKRAIYLITGCLSLALGAAGSLFPILPTVPFLLLAAFCFARSSEKLDRWFKSTRLYKENLESYVAGKGMTKKTKVRIMVTVTLLMTVGFVMMGAVPVGRVILACVWVFHLIYFIFGIKTIPAQEAETTAA